ncbi:MAG: protein-glutamate O-methyltransferase CheR [Deltaproteobacteria bacterium]|nr:protein-glutamate O-methyltransferase CheR [Deltaproteobacteria bacterium]
MSRLWEDPRFGPLAHELYRRCGLVFEGGQAHLFRKRVERRALEAGYGDVDSYLERLAFGIDPEEFERLVDLLTVNETFFFREPEHFRVLLDEFWPRWRERGEVRVWSAACSTGCEPYTLGMLLRERGWHEGVDILASDVSTRVLGEARQGVYTEFALRNTPAYYRQQYFRMEGARFHLDASVRSMVRFQRINLAGPEPWEPPGRFHAVFCRNVLIYFDLEAKRRVVGRLVASLRPGGVLVVGRSESLLSVPEAPPPLHRGGVVVYRLPEEAENGSEVSPFGWRSHV